MHPALIRARAIRINHDAEVERVALERKQAAEREACEQKLLCDAVNEAFGGVAAGGGWIDCTTVGPRGAIITCPKRGWSIGRKQRSDGDSYQIDGSGAKVYATLPELIDALAGEIAPFLDLDAPRREFYATLSRPQRELIRQALDAVLEHLEVGSWESRLPGAMIETDVAALRDLFEAKAAPGGAG